MPFSVCIPYYFIFNTSHTRTHAHTHTHTHTHTVLRVLHPGILSGGVWYIHLQPEASSGEEVEREDERSEEGAVPGENVQCGQHQGIMNVHVHVY